VSFELGFSHTSPNKLVSGSTDGMQETI